MFVQASHSNCESLVNLIQKFGRSTTLQNLSMCVLLGTGTWISRWQVGVYILACTTCHLHATSV
jgi:hypothetical protein